MKLYKMKWDYRFTFGKYEAKRVDEVFANGWYGKTYIAWAYYNKEDITFIDEILDALNIMDRIEKPGSCPEKYDAWVNTIPEDARQEIERYRNNLHMGVAAHRKALKRRADRNRLEKHEDAMERISGKGYLQWKNQGH